LQRQYCTFAVQFPSSEALYYIYNCILAGHLSAFSGDGHKLADRIVRATMDVHKVVADSFLPTAVKFHYQFNLRDISSIMEGICRARPEYFPNNMSLIRLWYHECNRVYCDRFITEDDIARFSDFMTDCAKKHFDDENQEAIHAQPLIVVSFVIPTNDDRRPYTGINDWVRLRKIMDDKLNEYNESHAVMDLVLFDQAIEHICRTTRIIDKPRGNALLVGVGGSGKQSLARLAASICNYETFQITVTASYGMADFRADLQTLYKKSGLKGIGLCFIMTDGQIVDERFLVYMNDLLASGNIPELFTIEEKDEVCNGIRPEVKQAGIVDSRENCWEFFIEKVRKYLHVVLCFSPVGDKFRIRSRQFPALTSCTSIDWFHPWPQDALMAVANRSGVH
jgi:dynein heavy chain, axonemal